MLTVYRYIVLLILFNPQWWGWGKDTKYKRTKRTRGNMEAQSLSKPTGANSTKGKQSSITGQRVGVSLIRKNQPPHALLNTDAYIPSPGGVYPNG